jgi:hypothetical protein
MASVVAVSNGEAGSSVRGKINSVIDAVNVVPRTVTGSFTVLATDDLDLIRVDSATDVVCTLPADLPAGFSTTIVQVGVGTFSLTAGSGATRNVRGDVYKSAGQWATVTAFVDTNAGAAAHWVGTGDLAA